MSDEGVTQTPAVFSSKERAALVAKALSEAARRARFSTKRRRALTTGSFRARRGVKLFRLLRLWTFIGIVVLPSTAAALYFGLIAADQYTAEARFTVRGGLPSAMGSPGSLSEAPSELIIQDTQVIMNYMQSRGIVEALDKSVALQHLYQNPEVDILSRLWRDQPIENVVGYWNRHISLDLQLPAGIVVFKTKAFSADDAVKISRAALDASEQVVNQMNDQMLKDAVSLAEKERERALSALAAARSTLETARNTEGMLSASAESQAMTDLMTTVQGNLLQLKQDYDSQRRFVRADAPQLKSLKSKIDAAADQVQQLRAQMTRLKEAGHGDRPALSGSMSRLDYAELNDQIAEKMYATSLIGLEQARLASETKLMYINDFVQPVTAEQAEFPKRGIDIGIFVAATLAIWAACIGVMIYLRSTNP